MTLAAQLRAEYGLSTALKMAWKEAKRRALKVIEITKKSGETSKRIVAERLTDYYTPSGAKKSVPGLIIFADVAKYLKGKNFVISTYKFINL